MILLNLTDEEIKEYRHQLSEQTYDFYMTYDLDIKPIAKSKEHFNEVGRKLSFLCECSSRRGEIV